MVPCVFAVAARFKEVLLLDCDVVPMRDPTYMFDAPEFRQNGNYFWGDIYGEGMFKDEAFDYIGTWLCSPHWLMDMCWVLGTVERVVVGWAPVLGTGFAGVSRRQFFAMWHTWQPPLVCGLLATSHIMWGAFCFPPSQLFVSAVQVWTGGCVQSWTRARQTSTDMLRAARS
jgi:hypothetical protein